MLFLKRSFYFYKRNFFTITVPILTIWFLGADYQRGQRYRVEQERKQSLNKAKETVAIQNI
jgi:hypothetical protein